MNIDPGTDDVSVTKQGFSKTTTQTKVTVGTAMTLTLSLQVRGWNVVVEVTVTRKESSYPNTTIGDTVTAIALDNLPKL